MSVLPSDLVAYGCADMPEADSVTIGGAVDFTCRVAFSDVDPTGLLDAVSSSASDTATKLEYFGRLSAGTSSGETLTLNGQTIVNGTKSLERLLYAATSGGGGTGKAITPAVTGTTAVGDVALISHIPVISGSTARAGSSSSAGTTPALFRLQTGDGVNVGVGNIIRTTGGTGPNQLRRVIAVSGYGVDIVAVNRDWGTVPDATTTYNVHEGILFEIAPNQVKYATRMFAFAAADVPTGSTRFYYEKFFVVNNNTATDLNVARVEFVSETPALNPGALLDFAMCTAANDTNTTTNRQTAPATGAGSFITQPALVSVAGGALAHGSAPNAAGGQGVWARLTVPAGSPLYKGSVALFVQGTTT